MRPTEPAGGPREDLRDAAVRLAADGPGAARAEKRQEDAQPPPTALLER
ncbi:hypothetical protein [Streptomyces sp. ODS28]